MINFLIGAAFVAVVISYFPSTGAYISDSLQKAYRWIKSLFVEVL